eukprot:TRINITY_DN13309_c0_g1_i2.p1 TRINITY_DN13309_c0_g1~~TRINITY_DN13309_c0_g1_i2.p1  ORF type:complete len:738 (-),score=151.00 TRINITY_DN13309_c0_g1_i2:84-2210(-)
MSSWFASKQARGHNASQQQRTADALASDLEQQVNQVADRPQTVTDLLLRWVELTDCDRGSGEFFTCAGDDIPGLQLFLSFREALLRSRAFEALLDRCSRSQALRAALQQGGQHTGSKNSGGKLSPTLAAGMDAIAERLLLPGGPSMWPKLLEALLIGNDGSPKGALRWEQWARRVLAAVKCSWQDEALPRLLDELDQKLIELAAKRGGCDEGSVSASPDGLMQQHGAGAKLSKQSIRAALARERLRNQASEAGELRARVELLCGACVRLGAVAAACAARTPKLERLLADAEDAIAAINASVKALYKEQESLSGSLSELGGELQRQITGIQMTQQTFAEKRDSLKEEQKVLLLRLEEIKRQLDQLEQEAGGCLVQEKQLKEQMSGTTAHFEQKIAKLVEEQQAMTEEKMRAVTFVECAHRALDIARQDANLRSSGVDGHLRRRRAELRSTLTKYVRIERVRVGIARECLDALCTVTQSPGNSDAMKDFQEASDIAQEAWDSSQQILQQAREVLGIDDAGHRVHSSIDEAENSKQAHEAGTAVGRASTTDHVKVATSDGDCEDAAIFFTRQGMQHCADCEEADAEWASVSLGIYLCTECAGRHRGLGVHLSFVRSTKMDRWSPWQLRCMQLGGNDAFRKFLAGYPQINGPISSNQALVTRYGSCAVSFYRRRLNLLTDGQAVEEVAPVAGEGCLPASAVTREIVDRGQDE